jgi:hypothetical protein
MGAPQQEFEQRALNSGLAGLGGLPRSLGAAAKEENMIKEALQYLLAMGEPIFREEQDGRLYSSRSLQEIMPPLPTPISVHTLAGFVALYKLRDNTNEKAFIHIVDHLNVLLVNKELDAWRRRENGVHAQVPSDTPRFRFGQYLDPDEFVVGLQTMFEDPQYDTDHQRVMRLVSNLAAEMVTISSDDGISQSVATRQGIVTKGEEKVVPRVRLSPWRTFREVSQPTSEFVLRLRGRQGQQPACALFEADGGSWKNDAIDTIKDFLAKELPSADIVA